MFPASIARTAGLGLALTALIGIAGCSSTTANTTATSPATHTASDTTASATTTATGPVGADGGPIQPVSGTGTLGAGFVDTAAPPTPGATLSPTSGSWATVHPPSGYHVALVSSDEDADTARLVRFVTSWAKANDVSLTVLHAKRSARYLNVLQKAIDLSPDLVLTVGQQLADPMAVVTASWGDQKFLLLGAELAEPTYNVTAALWQDGAYRGGADASSVSYDPTLFTRARVTRALSAGVAAVLRGYSGYVVKVG